MAIKLKPKYSEAYYQRGFSKKINYDYPDYKGSFEDLSKAIELRPTYTEAYFQRSSVNIFLGHFSDALKDINKAIKLGSKNVDSSKFYVLRSIIKFRLGDRLGAKNDAKTGKFPKLLENKTDIIDDTPDLQRCYEGDFTVCDMFSNDLKVQAILKAECVEGNSLKSCSRLGYIKQTKMASSYNTDVIIANTKEVYDLYVQACDFRFNDQDVYGCLGASDIASLIKDDKTELFYLRHACSNNGCSKLNSKEDRNNCKIACKRVGM